MTYRLRLIITAVLLITCVGTATWAQQQPGPGAPEQQWILPTIEAPQLQRVIFHSTAAATDISYFIYLPQAYDMETERRFPVLYWLHGSGGGFEGVRPISAYFGRAMREGKIPPMLVVFPNGLPNSLWVNSYDGSVPMETIVIEELLPHVDANFRTIAAREGRIVEGFSMGGYGAARFGLKYHDLFGASSSLAGGPFHPDFSHTPRVGPRNREQIFQAVFGGNLEYYRELSPWVLAEKNAEAVRDHLRLRLVAGEDDPLVGLNSEMSARLEELQIPHTFAAIEGVGHNSIPLLNALGEQNWAFYREFLAEIGK